MRVQISRRADRDVERIWQIIARDSLTVANQVEEKLLAAMKLLATTQGAGIAAPKSPTPAIGFGRCTRTRSRTDQSRICSLLCG